MTKSAGLLCFFRKLSKYDGIKVLRKLSGKHCRVPHQSSLNGRFIAGFNWIRREEVTWCADLIKMGGGWGGVWLKSDRTEVRWVVMRTVRSSRAILLPLSPPLYHLLFKKFFFFLIKFQFSLFCCFYLFWKKIFWVKITLNLIWNRQKVKTAARSWQKADGKFSADGKASFFYHFIIFN